MKHNKATHCNWNPSPTLIKVPEAHPPAVTIPIPNMIPPITVSIDKGATESVARGFPPVEIE